MNCNEFNAIERRRGRREKVMFGMTFSIVCVRAIVRNIETSSTKITYLLEYNTGQITAHYRLEEGDTSKAPDVMFNNYATAYGSTSKISDRPSSPAPSVESVPCEYVDIAESTPTPANLKTLRDVLTIPPELCLQTMEEEYDGPSTAKVLQIWQHTTVRTNCNENRIKTSKLNLPTTESLKHLTNAAADSRSLTKTFKTLRKYPPYSFLLRWTTEDYNLPNTEFLLKRDKVIKPRLKYLALSVLPVTKSMNFRRQKLAVIHESFSQQPVGDSLIK
uniref:Uncharacterized protein n=1 Tax=Glossina pallidipes TaxID=7398 RepID=A0A1A9Z0J2_GLOPL